MSVWKINGQTFSALRLGGLRRTLVSQSVDTVSFTATGARIDSTPLFSYGQAVAITKDGAPWFSGVITSTPIEGGPDTEGIAYQVSGPWWHLEKCVYQQTWQVWNTVLDSLVSITKSRVILGKGTGTTHITNGAQLAAAVSWAISRGAPMQLGLVDPAINLPYDEQVDITCSEVIIKMLRWSPDCVCFFDYSTIPATFHCRHKANLTPFLVTIPGPEFVQITPRPDLQIPGVVLRYEQTHTRSVADPDGDGPSRARETVYNTVVEDAAGNPEALATIHSTIELAGSRQTIFAQEIEMEDIPSDLRNVDWWIKHIPALDKEGRPALVFSNPSRTGASPSDYPKILTKGSVQSWMPVKARDEEFFVDVTSEVYDEQGNKKKSKRTVSFRATTVDYKGTGDVKTYMRTSSYEAAEPVPVGVAAALYAAWAPLQYDGQITLKGLEVSGRMGSVLRISGGLPAWASMDALVQQVSELVDAGETEITFGPAKQIDIADLISLLSSFRKRGFSYHYREPETGEVSSDADTGNGGIGQIAKNEPSQAREILHNLTLADGGNKISLDPLLCPHAGADIQPREMVVCVDGYPKKVTFLMSLPY
jgi:hypothetical protein